jgi:hypothetical protein
MGWSLSGCVEEGTKLWIAEGGGAEFQSVGHGCRRRSVPAVLQVQATLQIIAESAVKFSPAVKRLPGTQHFVGAA